MNFFYSSSNTSFIFFFFFRNLDGAVVCSDLNDLIKKINSPDYSNLIETAWVIGGSKVYESALKYGLCNRFYLTRIKKEFECDCFFNYDFTKDFKEVRSVSYRFVLF